MSSSKKSGRRARGERTRAVHGVHEGHGPLSTPIVHSATFSFPDLAAMNEAQGRGAAGAFYQRNGHPTLHAVECALADLEGAEAALLFSSGLAAIAATFFTLLKPGDHVLALRQCYGGTHMLLAWGAERCGWTYDLVDARTPEAWAAAFRPRTRLLHIESPTNPTLAVVDVKRAAQLAHEHGAKLVLDNTVASPIGQHGLDLGADFVAYSATKSIGGHGDLLAGIVMGAAADIEAVAKTRKVLGPVPDPQLAWQIERSVKTLPLRVAAQNANALELARRLSRHAGVRQVFYPGLESHAGHALAAAQMLAGFGPLLSFEVAGGAAAAEAMANALELVLHAPSLGGVESLVSLPAHTSHIHLGPEGRRAAGIPEGLVRLSAGVEDVEDLWADVSHAIEVATAAAAKA
jgi:cystathionine beta-lyase/cystathionine gamma-synthase